MRNKILQVLKKHFQYNDYKLGKIADEITEALEIKKPIEPIGRYCEKCIHSKTLIVTYVGENPNLCQRGRPKGDAINCPYYTEGVEMYDKTDYSTITKAFR